MELEVACIIVSTLRLTSKIVISILDKKFAEPFFHGDSILVPWMVVVKVVELLVNAAANIWR